jgi:hypothetical protein
MFLLAQLFRALPTVFGFEIRTVTRSPNCQSWATWANRKFKTGPGLGFHLAVGGQAERNERGINLGPQPQPASHQHAPEDS